MTTIIRPSTRLLSAPFRRLAERHLRLEVRSLKGKVTIGSCALGGLIVAVTYVLLSSAAHRAASAEAKRHASELARYFSRSVAESMALGDKMQVYLRARDVLENGAAGVVVVDTNGETLFSSWTADGAGGRPAAGDLIQVTEAVRFGEIPAGTARVWVSRDALEAQIHSAHAFVYPVLVVGVFLMGFLGLAALHSTFRSLSRLAAEAERIGAGDLSVRVPVDGDDEVARFSSAFNAMVDGVASARGEIEEKQLEAIRAMISAVEAKDPYTQGHCVRVRDLTRRLLEHSPETPRDRKNMIQTAALLHDVGKIGMPDRILFKRGRLTKKEIEVVRSHVTTGERILRHIDSLTDAARWIRHHHERWDGFGYPDGLREESIPFASRVIAVADALDAMLTDRPYRKALSPEDARDALMECSGSQFDPRVVEWATAVLQDTREPSSATCVASAKS